jgi:hypothetical protein
MMMARRTRSVEISTTIRLQIEGCSLSRLLPLNLYSKETEMNIWFNEVMVATYLLMAPVILNRAVRFAYRYYLRRDL